MTKKFPKTNEMKIAHTIRNEEKKMRTRSRGSRWGTRWRQRWRFGRWCSWCASAAVVRARSRCRRRTGAGPPMRRGGAATAARPRRPCSRCRSCGSPPAPAGGEAVRSCRPLPASRLLSSASLLLAPRLAQ
jgi:hypothetical protein